MKNYKHYLLSLFLLLLCLNGYSQQGPGRDRIKSLKVGFITEKVGLTSDEATSFWPIYMAHEEALGKLRRQERREVNGKMEEIEALSEYEIDKILNSLMSLEKEKQELNQNYLKEIRKVISAKKTLLLIQAEIAFKKRLLQEMQKRRRGER